MKNIFVTMISNYSHPSLKKESVKIYIPSTWHADNLEGWETWYGLYIFHRLGVYFFLIFWTIDHSRIFIRYVSS